MNLPNTVTEEEFMEAFQKVVARIKKRYKYSIYDGDDLAQEALFIACTIVEKYDKSKGPLYNFLSVSINNRIFNFIRDKRHREIDTVSMTKVEEEEICRIGNMKTSDDEFWKMIDEHLPPEYRTDYLKLRQGIQISSLRKSKLIYEIRRIINEYL